MEWVKGRAAEGITSFALPMDTDPADDRTAARAFVPNEVYLDVRVPQIWLTQERELWREFQPFAAVVSEFVHVGETRSLPAMLGASELSGKLSLVGAEDAIEIRNLRVAGPVPYEGDDVSVLMALFRTQTKDWIGRALGIVESIASSVSVPALIAAAPLANAIVEAVSQFLGQEGLELRCGQYQSWSSPEVPERPRSTELQPMHYVVMRRPARDGGAEPAAGFTVRDGRLYHNDKPYVDHDFVVLSVEAKRVRDDYRRLEFYEHWQQVRSHIIDGDLTAAERAWRRTMGALYTDELTGPQQAALFAEYKRRYDNMLDQFAVADEHAFRGRRGEPVSISVDEEDPMEILLAQS